jgi:cellulose synthase/poly-beta-1,6-N-acetylglucosamine synthase-like glycosyltransferase
VIVGTLLGGLALWTLGISTYLVGLTLAAAVWRRKGVPPAAAPARRFAICVPAHDEASRIPRLLTSIDRQTYPRARFDVHVVADNCTDQTAALSRSAGAIVHERVDPELRGKGFALRWLLGQVRDSGERYDAYVIVDADSTLDPDYLDRMNARLERGAEAIQAYYAVLDPEGSSLASLRSAALAAIHYVRPLGRSMLGWSAGLKGNGMCFTSSVMDRFGWRWFTLAEDVEFHLALVSAGVVVDFAPETTVRGEMPSTFAQARSQNARWERGRLHVLRHQVPGLLLDGVRLASPSRIDAAVEQLIPPLSIPLVVALGTAVTAGLTGHATSTLIAAAAVVGYGAHVVGSMLITRAPARAYKAFLLIPSYVAWKLALYVRALLPTRETGWQRTPRS